MKASDFQRTTETKLKRIAWLSSRNRQQGFNNLMHLINEELLEVCFNELNRKKAVGEDGVTKEAYGKQLQWNLKELVKKLKSMSYRPGNIRQVNIPKEGKPGETRPLGISNFEDKLFQKAVHKVLESIYEPLFLESSFGFRPGRGCHQAIKALHHHLYENEVATIIDIDLTNFFGTIDHALLQDILKEKVRDKRLLRYIVRMLKAGVLMEGELIVNEEGVAQGSTVSPILANIFAHYVLDRWIEEMVKPHCKGRVELFRYCDDAVICCQNKEEAEKVRRSLAKRLAKYKLKLNEDKTKMVVFSRSQYGQGKTSTSFDFLGFTYYWGRARNGFVLPKVKSCGKRLRSKLKKVKEWAKAVRNKYRLLEIWKRFTVKVGGHIRYFGVSFNIKHVRRFLDRATRILFKWLNRRSQKNSFTWEKFQQFIRGNPLPQAKIWQPLW